jgi:4-hydroxy-tetrahydrodipicolinate reductase
MRIALIGYGKMGKNIERIARQRGHEIVLRISTANKHELNEENLRHADVAIEFTQPEAAQANVVACLSADVPVVCGTTGWNEGLAHAEFKAIEHNTAFLQASNFSIGVNVFFELNKLLASLMDEQSDYKVSMEETHHTQKKDAPSGTAITLAEQIVENLKRIKHWTKGATSQPDLLGIESYRVENVPGTHHIKYSSAVDDIDIIHTAHNRDGFALGAILAAEFIYGKSGIFTMKDVLGINTI